jgi:hypothetical protein
MLLETGSLWERQGLKLRLRSRGEVNSLTSASQHLCPYPMRLLQSLG